MQGHQVEDTRLQFQGVEGLGEKIRGAGLQRFQPNRPLRLRGDHHDGHILIARLTAQPADHLDTVHLRHHIIDQHDVEIDGLAAGKGLERIGEAFDHTAGETTDGGLKGEKAGFAVVDDKKRHGRSR